MPAVIRCECGWEATAATREDAAAAMTEHLLAAHPDLAAPPTLPDLLAMAEEL